MRVRYSSVGPSKNGSTALPWLPLVLRNAGQDIEALGLVDSGATVNVLPYDLGTRLGGLWDDAQAAIRLSGNLGDRPAIPFFVTARVGDFLPIQLAFAWTQETHVPLILGQLNFFTEFDVCFYRSRLEFDVRQIAK